MIAFIQQNSTLARHDVHVREILKEKFSLLLGMLKEALSQNIFYSFNSMTLQNVGDHSSP